MKVVDMMDTLPFSFYFLIFWSASFLVNFLLNQNNPKRTGLYLMRASWIGLILQITYSLLVPIKSDTLLFYSDTTSRLLSTLILLIASITSTYSRSYLAGAKKEKQFYYNFSYLIFFLLVAISTDQIFLFFGSWLGANLCLSFLMVLNPQWSAASHAAALTRKYFLAGFGLGIIGACILAYYSHTTSISEIGQLHRTIPSFAKWMAMGCLTLATCIQSGLFPFHRWIVSSLNSPTPLSALMHAGLVNGGGIILVRFIPTLLDLPQLMNLIFIIGIVSTVLGTLWKLMQTDYKRMLACSTVGQMGFMFMQCGLGLFPAALAHLVLHGLFKAHLFLRSGSALTLPPNKEKKDLSLGLKIISSVGAGVLMASAFVFISTHTFLWYETSALLVGITALAGFQASLSIFPLLQSRTEIGRLLKGWTLFGCMGLVYGLSINVFNLYLWQIPWHPMQLSLVHVLGVSLFILALGMTLPFARHTPTWKKLYFKLLNSSAPSAQTITPNRLNYQW